jgi:hypothetical protein
VLYTLWRNVKQALTRYATFDILASIRAMPKGARAMSNKTINHDFNNRHLAA